MRMPDLRQIFTKEGRKFFFAENKALFSVRQNVSDDTAFDAQSHQCTEIIPVRQVIRKFDCQRLHLQAADREFLTMAVRAFSAVSLSHFPSV